MSRKGVLTVGALALVTAGLVAALIVQSAPATAAPQPSGPANTAEVTRTTLTETTDVSGTLGFGDAHPIGSRGQGTLTSVAPEGAVVHRGEALFAVDTEPVVLMIGALPAYRSLGPGDEGADVRQLEENLSALGYTGFTVDDEYTSSTAAAVKRWQKALGLDGTGRVELGRIVFEPSEVRVSTDAAAVGDQVGGGPVVQVSGTARHVDADVDVDDRDKITVGMPATVELPGGTTVPGTVATIGATAEKASDDDSSQPGAPVEATIPVVVDVSDPAAAAVFDQAPVRVSVAARTAQDVLAVPVGALLALAEGGYGLEVVQGGTSRVVAVRTGMFAGGKVEVSGGGIAEGTVVGVAGR
jgi:peptidoglycan hydrolase-like protein with peptidoglycan-binding domain